MSEHPAPYRLEALMVGETDPDAEAHLAGCDDCRGYVSALRADRSAMLEEIPATAFLVQPEIKAAMETVAAGAQRSPWAWVRWLLPVACVGAAALIFMVGAPADRAGMGRPDEILIKGAGVGIEAVRKRGGQQSVHAGEVQVMEGDLLRVRLKLGARQRLAVGLLADDGEWRTLVEGEWFEPGSHFVKGDAISIGAGPTTGQILVGPPDAVAKVRRQVPDERVTVLHIRARPAQ